jgi:vacuolar-type H+-ATPase subunit H
VKEVLEEILQAEKEAEKTVSGARERAAEIRKEAESKSSRIIEDARKEAQAVYSRKISDAEKSAEERYTREIRKAEEQIDQSAAGGEKNTPELVRNIVSRLLSPRVSERD